MPREMTQDFVVNVTRPAPATVVLRKGDIVIADLAAICQHTFVRLGTNAHALLQSGTPTSTKTQKHFARRDGTAYRRTSFLDSDMDRGSVPVSAQRGTSLTN